MTHYLFLYELTGNRARSSKLLECQDIQSRALELNSPTQGLFAYHLWRWSNDGNTSYDDAYQTMDTCGYVPFSGYPLTKS